MHGGLRAAGRGQRTAGAAGPGRPDAGGPSGSGGGESKSSMGGASRKGSGGRRRADETTENTRIWNKKEMKYTEWQGNQKWRPIFAKCIV